MMLKTLLATAAISVAIGGAANAAITFTSAPIGSATVGETIIDNFDTLNALAPGYTLTGGQTFFASVPNVAVEPGGDTSPGFFAVTAGQTAVLNVLGAPLTSFSLDIGSLDAYNTISFSGSGGTQVFNGSSLATTGPASGTQSGTVDNRQFTFAFNGATVNSISFTSAQNSLEVDNFAVSAAPEPATWAMMLMGVFGIGAVLRTVRRRSGAAFAAA